ncbi:hypothetical protein ACHAXT_009551 [Thalassiosira profunda]
MASSSSLLFQRGDTEIDEDDWKSFCDDMNETLELPTISVPARHVHWLLSNKDSPVKSLLATRMEELDGVHPPVKVVRDCDALDAKDECDGDGAPQKRKRILLDYRLAMPDRGEDRAMRQWFDGELRKKRQETEDRQREVRRRRNKQFPARPEERQSYENERADGGKETNLHQDGPLLQLTRQLPAVPEHILQRLTDEFDAVPGKSERIDVAYHNQPVHRILSKILPPDAQPPPSSYEQIGHVAHVNLRQPHLPYRKLIGRVMLDRLQSSIRTVVNKLGEVGGPYRTYQTELLAGEDDYVVRVIEHGVALRFDLRKVYWCTRLEGERTRMIEHEFKPNQLVADAFCGVGALCIRAAVAKGCRILANDLNPDAVAYCTDSAGRSGIDVGGPTFRVHCGDASQFIMNLGIDPSELPDHLVLNFPLDSPSFLNALRWWPSGGTTDSPPRVHLYTFARGDEERTAAEVAIDLVADGLLPEGGYVEPSKFRGAYLDELGCEVKAREVRDAAPGKLVICVSFSVTSLLLRRMQGDYGLD